MSFISSFKKALGFPDEYDDELDDTAEADNIHDDNDHSDMAESVSATASSEQAELETPKDMDHALPGDIFDAVLEQFNAIQPDFVRQCLSIEAQRRYLIERMSETLRARLESEIAAARKRGELQWEAEKQKMASDLERLKSEYHSLKQQREEFQSAQLSAARQKRALSERVHDLESQVNSLEAEKEQYQLENRSMLNKLRAASIRSGAEGDADAELERLAQENAKLQDSVKSLNDRLTQSDNEISELKDTNRKLQSDLEARIAEAKADDERITAEQQEVLAEIEEQLKQFEAIKQKKDAKIASLKSALKESAEKLAATETDRSRSEEELKAEIRRLTELLQATPANDRPKSRKTGKSRNKTVENNMEILQFELNTTETPGPIKISAIDELMDSTDWFTAPDPVPLKKDPEVDEDFGYKEPVKRTSRDDDKQLSLF